MFGIADIILVIFGITIAVLVGLYFLNRWSAKKYGEHQNIIEKTKMSVNIYVIDKKMDKINNANLPKAVQGQIPKIYKYMKMPLVKAKVGPQILTLMSDKKVYNALQVKKNAMVEIAGMYIVSMKGMKSEKELKEAARNKKAKDKALKKADVKK